MVGSENEPSIIFGLDFQARTLTPILGDQDRIRFAIGTQGLKSPNQVYVLEVDDDSSQITTRAYPHSEGEVWHLAAHPEESALLSTCYSSVEENKLKMTCSVWKMGGGDLTPGIGPTEQGSLEKVSCYNSMEQNSSFACFRWRPPQGAGTDRALLLHGTTLSIFDALFKEREMEPLNTVEVESRSHGRFQAGQWNPHHGSNLVVAAIDCSVRTWDIRTMKEGFSIKSAHAPTVRDVDLNANRQYVLATAGDDSKIRIWDMRSVEQPLKTISGHSHWVWCVRFNPTHDQLILSCSSDAAVILHSAVSVSSEASPPATQSDDEQPTLKDGTIGSYGEYEESVYCCDWSAADPWTYASLSYDGRIIVNRVSSSVKYSILEAL